MGSKKNPGKYDCFAKAKDDEPIFVLLARDPLAPMLVRLWADLTALTNKAGNSKEKAQEALMCALQMKVWADAQPQKKQ